MPGGEPGLTVEESDVEVAAFVIGCFAFVLSVVGLGWQIVTWRHEHRFDVQVWVEEVPLVEPGSGQYGVVVVIRNTGATSEAVQHVSLVYSEDSAIVGDDVRLGPTSVQDWGVAGSELPPDLARRRRACGWGSMGGSTSTSRLAAVNYCLRALPSPCVPLRCGAHWFLVPAEQLRLRLSLFDGDDWMETYPPLRTLVYAGEGDDIVTGDRVYGADGDDWIVGRRLYGGRGADFVNGVNGESESIVYGGPGRTSSLPLAGSTVVRATTGSMTQTSNGRTT